MSEDFLGLFASETEVVTLMPGEVLFEKGEPGHLMYVVKAGSLQVHEGNYVFETVSAGGILGEMAVVDGSPRSATVRAIEPSIFIPIDERRFLFMVQQTPFFALRVMRVMTARLRAINERIVFEAKRREAGAGIDQHVESLVVGRRPPPRAAFSDHVAFLIG